MRETQGEVILEVKNLKVHFHSEVGAVKAVNDASFSLRKGETLGIVGESGSGKSVTSLSILNLIASPPGAIVGGQIFYKGRDILKMNPLELRALRGGDISLVFQDPMTSLNPFLRISKQLVETIVLHQKVPPKEALDKAIHMLESVGIPSPQKRVHDYPHQFSGGMRQRVTIAMALSCYPQILIADEPTTALDVTIEAQILHLLKRLAKEFETAIILITHDLGVVAQLCDRVCVMYGGRIVERGTVEEIFYSAAHPYTQALLKAVPRIDQQGRALETIEGQPLQLLEGVDFCPFSARCNQAHYPCNIKYPPRASLSETHSTDCWLFEDKEPV